MSGAIQLWTFSGGPRSQLINLFIINSTKPNINKKGKKGNASTKDINSNHDNLQMAAQSPNNTNKYTNRQIKSCQLEFEMVHKQSLNYLCGDVIYH